MGKSRKILFLINPISGGGKARKVINIIDSCFANCVDEAIIHETLPYGQTEVLLKELLSQQLDALIVVGGDGTINEIAANMIGQNIPLGIIPIGSGNGIARHLKIPLRYSRAMETIMQGKSIMIDVGYVSGNIAGAPAQEIRKRPFFNIAGVGYDAHVAERFSESKNRGYWNYVRSMLKTLSGYKKEEYHLVMGDIKIEKEAFLVACSNGSQYGFRALIAPYADMQDGLLEISVVDNVSWWSAGKVLYHLFSGRMNRLKVVDNYQSPWVEFKNLKETIMHLDGEVIRVEGDLSIWVEPAQLKVIVP